MPDRIVADGRRRLVESQEYQAAAAEARARVLAEFEPRIAAANPLTLLVLRFQQWLAIREALAALAPPSAMYVTRSDAGLAPTSEQAPQPDAPEVGAQ